MEKEKKSGFLKLGKLFTKSRTNEPQKVDNGDTKEIYHQSPSRQEEEQDDAGERNLLKEPSSPVETLSQMELSLPAEDNWPPEGKKRPFGSWRLKKRRSLTSVPISPPLSPEPTGTKIRSFESEDEHDSQRYSIFLHSPEYSEILLINQKESHHIFEEYEEKSKTQPAESPKKDTTRKPVLGKFGNFFNSSKKRSSKDSPTSPTADRTSPSAKTTEKEPLKEKKKGQTSLTSDNKVNSHRTTRTNPPSDQVSKATGSQAAQPKEIANGKNNNGLASLHECNETDTSVLETEAPLAEAEKFTDHPLAAETPSVTDAFSDTSHKPAQSPSGRLDRQNSTEKNVRHLANSPGKRLCAVEGELGKVSTRKLQALSSEVSINKDELHRASPKKVSKFSSKITESKLRITDKPGHSVNASEASNGTKAASGKSSEDQEKLSASPSQESVDGRPPSRGSISPRHSPATKEISSGSQHNKVKGHTSSDNSKTLAFDIYLSKSSGRNSQEGQSNGDSMEKGNKRFNRKRRSLKSQTSQNEEKKTEMADLEEPAFGNTFTFEEITQMPDSPENTVNPVPLSPETNGFSSANQDSKAGANHKLSPKGESDKSKQQHPASSPGKKKKENQSLSSSPTTNKEHIKDILLKNQPALPANATEGNQLVVPVSTTKDVYVEKALVAGSSAGSGGECAAALSTNESTTLTAGADLDSRTQHETSHTNGHLKYITTDLETAKQKNSATETSKSLITSKLNIPPKPKNVELSIKPKGADGIETVQDPTTEQQIHRGNTANKVSLFENKRSSHRIDIYATKNISQPKKFVERAKLSFGQKAKGAFQRDHNRSNRQLNELKSPDSTKLQNIQLDKAKLEASQADVTNKKVEFKKKLDFRGALVNQEQMEDLKHDLDTVVITSSKEQTDSSFPLNEQKSDNNLIVNEEPSGDLKSFVSHLGENIIAKPSAVSGDAVSDTKTEEKLLHPSIDSAIDVCEDLTTKQSVDMGNANAKYIFRSNDLQPEPSQENCGSASTYSAHLVVSQSNTEPVELIGSNKVTDIENETLDLHSDLALAESTVPETKISKDESPVIEPVNNTDRDLQIVTTHELPESEPTISEEIRESPGNEEVTNRAFEHKKEFPESEDKLCTKEGNHDDSFLQLIPNDDIHQVNYKDSNSESAPGLVIVDANTVSDKKEVSDCITQSPGISVSSQSTDVFENKTDEEEHLLSSAGSLKPQREGSPLTIPPNVTEISDTMDETHSLSSDQALDSSVTENASQDEHKEHICVSNVQKETNDVYVSEDGENGVASPVAVTYDMLSLKANESDLGRAIKRREQDEDIFYDAADYSEKEAVPSIDSGIGVEYTKDTNVLYEANGKLIQEDGPVDTINELQEKDVSAVITDPSLGLVPCVQQNGSINVDATPHSNVIVHNRQSLEQNFSPIQNRSLTCLNASAASEEGTFDSSSDMESFAETIRKLESPITIHQKRKNARAPKSPGPYCGLPPIREDFLEKILDNDNFPFGLGKKERAKDQSPMSLFKMQSKATAEKMKPKRVSAEQSLLLKSLKTTREPLVKPQETCDNKENADVTDLAVKRSRIESMYSSLKSPFAARSEDNVFSPSVTSISTITTSFATIKDSTPTGKISDLKTTDSANTAQIPALETKADTTCNEYVALEFSDNSVKPAIPTFPSSMEEYLKANNLTQDNIRLPEVNLPDIVDSPGGKRTGEFPLESTPKSNSVSSDTTANDIFYFKGHEPNSALSDLGPQLSAFPLNGKEKINPRPGKLVIFSEANCEGTVIEVFTDVVDCSSWELSPNICIKTVRGCWILYEHPHFEGRSIALEEGDLELTNIWGEDSEDENSPSPTVIGSLSHVVKDYRICQIDLFTEPEGLGIMTSYFDDTEELQVYGRLQKTCSIKVHWGVWLIYEEADFQGIPYIIEPGEYPDLSFWNTHEAYIGSMRPLKMGCRKIEVPYEPKIVIFEKPFFEGRHIEFENEMLKLEDLEYAEDDGEETALPFTTVGSVRVIGGLWVGYEKPGFDGHQYLLEEGDYAEWPHWGGCNDLLQSLRPVLADFSAPHMTMFSESDCDEKAPNINVLGIIANMDETGYGVRTQSINVQSGVWVAYELPDFTGAQYILEKGIYSNFSDWGGKNSKISSVQPVLLDTVENPRGHTKVELFSEPDFQGTSKIFDGDTQNVEDSFATKSCKVISGRWAMYEQCDFSGNLYVLEEGTYPNLCAMGCQQDTTIQSLKTINYEFSEPSIVLYGKENFKGRKINITSESTNVQSMGYSPDLLSVEVLGGIWVLYECCNYRGHQVFLLPGKVAQWQKFCGWNKIGSLRPLQQKRLYFKLRNKGTKMFMSTNGTMDDIKLLRIQVMEETGVEDQIWVYQEGLLKCRIAEDCSLATSGTLFTAGSKLRLTLEQTGTSMHWRFSPDGRIHSCAKPSLVFDIKGGNQYDQQHVILSNMTEGKLTQYWEICVL
ncbi:beta/gamma crystallin domain-containing protein 1 [Bombina bombina]|uniref:beta/gamma crystallin domain-containing protein 1 n=1 Tax=Bombina bombina TaxID=8345 RepID=UPI00235B0137|nr:beta/gamma crystallin domain-containing protein 1 [Bombina bombina]